MSLKGNLLAGCIMRTLEIIAIRSRKKQKNNSLSFAFNHVFRCSKCQGAVVGINPKENQVYYRCSNSKCGNYKHNKPERQLLSETMALVSKAKIPDTIIAQVVQTLKSSVEAKNRLQTEMLNTLVTEKKRVSNRLDQMYVDKLDGCITKQQYDNVQENQSKRLREIDIELSKITSSSENFYLTAESVLNLVSRSKELFEKATDTERQNILKLISYNSVADGLEY